MRFQSLASKFIKRPPIITIMGHVDHGKTSLLDALRNSNIAQGEAGAITQHIGAFSVKVKNDLLTFLDTPGHEAFSAMRGRGSKVTDIIILVVAADDGVMPQTLESIKLAQKDDVPLIVALNKMDKGVQKKIDGVKRDLMNAGVELEDMGGNVQIIPISAKTKMGLETLKEAIQVQAEIMELQGDSKGPVEADVIEAKMSMGFGPLATILIKKGTLKRGDILVAGDTWGKVRSLKNEFGANLKEAGLSCPVEISGLKDLPKAGDYVIQVDNESSAKKLIQEKNSVPDLEQVIKPAKISQTKKQPTLSDEPIQDTNEAQGPIPFPIIVKADVQGSLEALLDSIFSLPSHEVKVEIVSSGVGLIAESDLDLASATNATIFTFNQTQSRKMLAAGQNRNIPIFQHNIIYSFLADVKEQMSQLLPPDKIYTVVGEAEILESFQLRGKVAQKIAGCKIKTGKITKSGIIKILRDRQPIYDGSIGTFKHHKKDITEAAKNLECGIGFDDFSDFEVGDIIQCLSLSLVKHLAHVDCIDQSFNSYPLTTAPAGYACLACHKPVISNESTQIAKIIRDTFKNSKWAESIINSILKEPALTIKTSSPEVLDQNAKPHIKIPVYDSDPDNDKYGSNRRLSSSTSNL